VYRRIAIINHTQPRQTDEPKETVVNYGGRTGIGLPRVTIPEIEEEASLWTQPITVINMMIRKLDKTEVEIFPTFTLNPLSFKMKFK